MNNQSSQEAYYGDKKGELLSYLEFGSIDLKGAKKTIWGYWQDQDAYDFYMFARYARDLFLFRDFISQDDKTIKELCECIKKTAHDKIVDYLFKYAGVITLIEAGKQEGGVCESGSSLFGFIEEVIATDYALNNGKYISKINNLKYLGSDISEMMNRGAEIFHPENSFAFSTADTIDKLMEEYKGIGMFYGLSISLRYALRKADDIVKVALQSELVVLNRLSLSYEGDIQIKAGTGKYAYVVSVERLKQLLQQNGLYANYTTENMQKNKDGEHTVRISLIISRTKSLLDSFIELYDSYTREAASVIEDYRFGEWKEFKSIVEDKE